MRIKKILLTFLSITLLASVSLSATACSENHTWPDYPLELNCEFIWNPPDGDNEVGITLTVTNNQENPITQFTVYLFTQTFFDYIKGNPSVDSKRITIYDLSLTQGESYSVDVSFNFIFDGLDTAKSVKGALYGTWVEFDNGISQWGDEEISERAEIYKYGFKLALSPSSLPKD